MRGLGIRSSKFLFSLNIILKVIRSKALLFGIGRAFLYLIIIKTKSYLSLPLHVDLSHLEVFFNINFRRLFCHQFHKYLTVILPKSKKHYQSFINTLELAKNAS